VDLRRPDGGSLGFLRADAHLCASSFDPGGGSLLALGTDGELRAWRLGAATVHAGLALEGYGESLAGSPDGSLVAARTSQEIALVRRDPLSVVWRASPVRPGSPGSAPTAPIAWIDDDELLVPFEESAPEGRYVGRTATFFYLVARSAPVLRARVRAPGWGTLVTDPPREGDPRHQ